MFRPLRAFHVKMTQYFYYTLSMYYTPMFHITFSVYWPVLPYEQFLDDDSINLPYLRKITFYWMYRHKQRINSNKTSHQYKIHRYGFRDTYTGLLIRLIFWANITMLQQISKYNLNIGDILHYFGDHFCLEPLYRH